MGIPARRRPRWLWQTRIEEIGRFDPERLSDLLEAVDRERLLGTLYLADVGAMKAGPIPKLLLGPPNGDTPPTDLGRHQFPKQSRPIHAGHPRKVSQPAGSGPQTMVYNSPLVWPATLGVSYATFLHDASSVACSLAIEIP